MLTNNYWLILQFSLFLSARGNSCNDGYIHFHVAYGIDTPVYIRDAQVNISSY